MRKADHILVTLRISSQTLSAVAMGNVLAAKATRSYEKGDPMNKRNVGDMLRQESAWFLESSADPSRALDGHIHEIASFLESHLERLKKLEKECKIDIVCGLFSGNTNGSIYLDNPMIRRIASLEIEVEIIFDLYMGLADT